MSAVASPGMLHPLLPKLKELKLSGMLNTLEVRAAQAVEGHFSPTEFLALLLDDELERRNQNQLKLRLFQAGCQQRKTLARFDFGAVPTLNRSRVLELATCGFIGRRENVLICGPTGVGKSHLASAFSYEAIKRGYRAVMKSVYELLSDLHAAKAHGTYRRKMTKL